MPAGRLATCPYIERHIWKISLTRRLSALQNPINPSWSLSGVFEAEFLRSLSGLHRRKIGSCHGIFRLLCHEHLHNELVS